MTRALFDPNLTGRPRMGRVAFIGHTNQWLTRPLLLDRCLTGDTASAACFLPEVPHGVLDAPIGRETVDEQDGGIGNPGYEINCNRVFFQYQLLRTLHEIDAELAGVEPRILKLLREVTK